MSKSYSGSAGALTCLLLAHTLATAAFAENPVKPRRAILFVIDGLRTEAPQRLGLENFQALAKQGTLFRKAYQVLPAHPKSGSWAQIHTSSIPNPVMLSGTLFIRPDTPLIQEMFGKEAFTAHLASTRDAYRSINRDFNYSYLASSGDERAVEWAIRVMDHEEVIYMRIHLQDTGIGGRRSTEETARAPWKNNIWGEGSHYIQAARKADALLGQFVDALKDMGKWSDTLLIVTADHGQADTGYHPIDDEDSSITPLLFIGPGVARGREFEYAEQMDLVPTLCDLMGVPAPATGQGSGVVLEEIKESHSGASRSRPQRLRKINETLIDYYRLLPLAEEKAKDDPEFKQRLATWRSEVYSLDRFTEWHEAGTIKNLLETNERAIRNLREALRE